jgi:hypothetical protein
VKLQAVAQDVEVFEKECWFNLLVSRLGAEFCWCSKVVEGGYESSTRILIREPDCMPKSASFVLEHLDFQFRLNTFFVNVCCEVRVFDDIFHSFSNWINEFLTNLFKAFIYFVS